MCKVRHTASNRPKKLSDKFIKNSNETTEDRSLITKGINSPLNNNEGPRTFSGLQVDMHKSVQSNPKSLRNVKSSWGLHESIEIHKKEDCDKLIQIINEKNAIIEELQKENQRLKHKLANKPSIKPLDKTKPLPQRTKPRTIFLTNL